MNFSVTLLMTEQCNLRCSYCYEEFKYKKSNEEELRKILLLLETLSKTYSTIDVSFFGGEPMLAYNNINRIIRENKNLPSELNYSITTNGVFLSEEKSRFLVENNLRQVQITLDGAKEDHDSIRTNKKKNPTFETIYNNAKNFKKLSGEFNFVFRVNASPLNSSHLDRLFYSLVEDFSDDPRFMVLLRPVGKWGGVNDTTLETLNTIEFSDIKKLFKNIVPEKMQWAGVPSTCYAALPNHLLVYPDGRLGKCTVGIHDDINSIGNITNEGKIDIDKNKFAFWTRGFVSGRSDQKGCPYWAG